MENNTSSYKKKIVEIFVSNKAESLKFLRAFLRGTFYIVFYRLITQNVRIRFPFIAHCKVRIRGPGYVSIGKKCFALFNTFQGLTIVTLSKEAKVIIGERCSLGGVTIRCYNEIRIGDRSMSAYCLIQDTPFCEIRVAKGLTDWDKLVVKPIWIGKNVWIGGSTSILSGTIIEDDSVISLGSLCCNIKIEKYCIASGNPIFNSLKIEKLLDLLDHKRFITNSQI
jgi:acetyltransferase-like isoleucine patch superfamily enzyme